MLYLMTQYIQYIILLVRNKLYHIHMLQQLILCYFIQSCFKGKLTINMKASAKRK
jgi:hypothetical protein